MSDKKRLFLFAAYDPNGKIGHALTYYVRTLQSFGDVAFCMDNKFSEHEIKKLKMHPMSVFITRHKEYDFGSYKRSFQHVRDNGLLENYEYIYLVNDSVFGPMFNISKLIHKMETISTDAVGIIESKHKTHSFMESWFIRLNKKIFLSPWFDEFISSVQKEQRKSMITVKYEHGLTKLIEQHGCSWSCVYTVRGRKTYNKPNNRKI